MKQLKLLPVMVCLMAQPAFAQQDANTEAPKWTYKMSGFIDPQFWMDTREVVSASITAFSESSKSARLVL